MKSLFHVVPRNVYFVVGALSGIPSVCDLLTGVVFGNVEDVIRGITGSVMASYLLFCALVIDRGGVALLDTRKVQLVGYGVLAIFAAGFLSDVSTTLQLAPYTGRF